MNSYVLYTKSDRKRNHLQYKTTIIAKIIEKYQSVEFSVKRGRSSAEHPPSRLSDRHFVVYISSAEKKTNPTRQCIICGSKRGGRSSNIPEDIGAWGFEQRDPPYIVL
ncbi:hypothetical protein TNCV_4209271 [Trichonephila clavipes]|nr:hypothetical protein TNCV_4209271 [Trichonephila clavipes]